MGVLSEDSRETPFGDGAGVLGPWDNRQRTEIYERKRITVYLF